MRFILALLLILSVPTHAEVQTYETQLPIICGDTNNLLQGLREEYEEEIVMMAEGYNHKGDDLYHSLWINTGNQTWTFVVVNKQAKTTCVLASGDRFQMFFPGNGI
jgi:hypothetical protein